MHSATHATSPSPSAATGDDSTDGPRLGQHPTIRALSAWHADLRAIRRELHQTPELGFEEHLTSELVARQLERYGVDEIHRGIGRTGVVGVVRGRSTSSGRSVGLRADMDALPMQEKNDFAHRSRVDGRMHGCGHDGHTTMLLGAARQLAATRQFDGTVNLIFQPGEEGFAGGQAMIDDGLFDRFPCDRIFAMHNWPALPAGKVGVRAGPALAAADRITIHVRGRGGHGAHPYLSTDPVVVAAHIIVASQSIVSRNVPAIDSAVLSLCAVQAGDLGAMSVIPNEATIVGTVRSFSEQTQELVEQRLRAICEHTAAAFGATATLSYERLYPATINDPVQSLFGQEVAAEVFGPENLVTSLPPSMGAEDFAFMLRVRPGAYFRIGQGGGRSGCFLHEAQYDFNDDILPSGSALFVRLAERAMPITSPAE